MHEYLRSIGFTGLHTKEQEEKLLASIIANPTTKRIVSNRETRDYLYAEYIMEFAGGVGLKLCGTLDESERFHLDNYFPYVEGRYISTTEQAYIEKKINSLSYSGMCEDNRVGISLIFHINNPAEHISVSDDSDVIENEIYLSGMSTEAIVLLPTKNSFKIINGDNKTKEYTKTLAEAKNGEKEAIDKLAYAELDTYMDITNRLTNKEDIFSIVESSIMPYGMESELYKIIGLILEVGVYENKSLNEKVYRLKVLANGITFDIVVNAKDISGFVVAGMRFKGVVWLQGKVVTKK